jgi:hypothetical protein
LAWASDLATITENDISIIKHARKSLLFGNAANYGQKKMEATVYLTSLWVVSTALKFVSWCMGLFILNHLGKRFGKENIGLYRDDGLAFVTYKQIRPFTRQN